MNGNMAVNERLFPDLARTGYRLTSPPDPVYNCIAWAAGFTDACSPEYFFGTGGHQACEGGPPLVLCCIKMPSAEEWR